MNYQTLRAHLGEVGAKRVILTHMGADMLARLDGLPDAFAEDGLVVEIP